MIDYLSVVLVALLLPVTTATMHRCCAEADLLLSVFLNTTTLYHDLLFV
jgi:hypothetical protein